MLVTPPFFRKNPRRSRGKIFGPFLLILGQKFKFSKFKSHVLITPPLFNSGSDFSRMGFLLSKKRYLLVCISFALDLKFFKNPGLILYMRHNQIKRNDSGDFAHSRIKRGNEIFYWNLWIITTLKEQRFFLPPCRWEPKYTTSSGKASGKEIPIGIPYRELLFPYRDFSLIIFSN